MTDLLTTLERHRDAIAAAQTSDEALAHEDALRLALWNNRARIAAGLE